MHEIRVHGVNNSPPAEMLETTPDAIEVAVGAGTGLFWKRKVDTPSDGVDTMEAYSWGAQSRTGSGALAVIGAALVRVGWFLLLPYAFVNLAYWTRKIPPQTGQYRAWSGGLGAGVVRVFGLVVTLLAVTAFTAVAVDVIAVDCYAVGDESRRVCSGLPGVFDGLAGWSQASRSALLGLLPIVVLVVLYLITRRGRVSYEAGVESFSRSLAGADEPGRPLLSTPGFWGAARVRDTSEFLHLAAATFFVVLLLAARPPLDDPRRAVFTVAAAVGLAVCVVVLIWASTTRTHTLSPGLRRLPPGVAARVARQLAKPPAVRVREKQMSAGGALLAAAVLYAAWLVVAGGIPDPTAAQAAIRPFPTPTALIAVGLLLALWALTWSRRSRPRRWAGGILLALAGGCFLATSGVLETDGVVPDPVAVTVTIAGLALVAVHLVLCALPPAPMVRGEADPPRAALAFRAWQGRGAAVAMILALLVAVVLDSLLVLGATMFLGAVPPIGTDRIWRLLGSPLDATRWSAPDPYEKAAVILTGVVAATLVLLVVVGIRLLAGRSLRMLTLPAVSWRRPDGIAATTERTEDLDSGVVEWDADAAYPPRYVSQVGDPDLDPDEVQTWVHADARAGKRRFAQLLHRGEPLTGWVVAFTAVGFLVLSSPGVVEGVRRLLDGWQPGASGVVVAIAVGVVGAVGIGALVRTVADAATRRERPLGIFWDVVAFLPRAGHPFAPPCYAERAVPELADRIRSLVRGPHPDGPGGAVLLSAHSMGTTISAATILALRGDDDGRSGVITDRLALLSFGSQLRGYFSRFFPSVFGPTVLGVPGLRAPSLFSFDPWQKQVQHEFAHPGEGVPDAAPPDPATAVTLTAMLGAHGRTVPRWRNLWRRTDYLGFPVFGYPSAGNPIDRGASERAPGYLWALADHSPYLGQEQFHEARQVLATELREPEPRPPGTA